MDQKTEIRNYIKYRIRLNIDSKQIFNGLCGICGPQTISMCTPKTSVTKANIAAVKIVVKQDAQLSVKDIASHTGISEGSVQTILKKRLDLRKVCARWVPH